VDTGENPLHIRTWGTCNELLDSLIQREIADDFPSFLGDSINVYAKFDSFE
jgi:hypothetical protein